MIDILRYAWRKCRAAASALAGAVRASVTPTRYRLELVDGSMPARLRGRTLYILTEDGRPWVASMECPCGCREILEMNLLQDERPRWRYTVDPMGWPSLHPSVWRKIGCESHFFLRNGRIVWSSETSPAEGRY